MRKIWIAAGAAVVLTGCALYQCNSSHTRQIGRNDRPAAGSESAGRLVPLDQIDHAEWDRLLKRYVDGDGLVDYAAWKKSPGDLAALAGYLEALGSGDPQARTSRQGRLAFWINAYNSVTVHGILQEYPTSSIRNHTAVALGYNIWEDLLLGVGSESYSLNDIEHKILRKLGEPRIHFAVVCASVGCPRLRNEAYTPERLESQLADNTRDFFARRRNLQVDLSRRAIRVSSILDWFGEDFGPTPQKGLATLVEYMPDEPTRRMIEQGNFTVEYLDYDWSLNEQ